MSKEEIRKSVSTLPPNSAVKGHLAESVRQLDVYRKSQAVFVDPSPVLLQIRVNALVDGKDLIMPSAGLKQGFYLLKAYSLPFKKLLYAVTMKGAAALGQRLGQGGLSKLDIGLFLTGAQALDSNGGRVGSGAGFFDLSVAILAASEAFATDYAFYGVIDNVRRRVGQIDLEAWDVLMGGVVSPEGIYETGAVGAMPEILWDKLTAKKIRKIDPLWALCPESRRELFFKDSTRSGAPHICPLKPA